MKEKIYEMLNTKVNEIFFNLQNENGIESGDIEPCDYLELESKMKEMSELIETVIRKEM